MSKLRLIQSGVGGFGKTWALRVLPNSRDFDLVAIADPNPAARQEAGGTLQIPADRQFSDLATAVASVEADAVLSCTPPAARLEQARTTFAAGLHLMIEKPFANDMATAKEVLRIAEESGRELVVSQNYRYNPRAAVVRNLIEQRALGEFGHGHIDFYIPADFTGTFREKMPHVLLVDMAIHHLDLLRYLTGRDVVAVTAHTFRPTWSWYGHNPGLKMMLQLEGEACFTYSGDWSARGRNTGWSGDWRIQCEHGSIHWSHNDVSIARSSRGFTDDTNVVKLEVPVLALDGQHATLATFAEAIRTGVPAPTCGQDNLQSFAAVMAAVKSAEAGRPVALAEVLE